MDVMPARRGGRGTAWYGSGRGATLPGTGQADRPHLLSLGEGPSARCVELPIGIPVGVVCTESRVRR